MLMDNNQIFRNCFVIIYCHLTKVASLINKFIIFEPNELSITLSTLWFYSLARTALCFGLRTDRCISLSLSLTLPTFYNNNNNWNGIQGKYQQFRSCRCPCQLQQCELFISCSYVLTCILLILRATNCVYRVWND